MSHEDEEEIPFYGDEDEAQTVAVKKTNDAK